MCIKCDYTQPFMFELNRLCVPVIWKNMDWTTPGLTSIQPGRVANDAFALPPAPPAEVASTAAKAAIHAPAAEFVRIGVKQ